VLPENVRLIVSILTVLCLLGVSSGRDRERTLDEPVRAQLTQAKQLPVIAAARRQVSLLDTHLHTFTVIEPVELVDHRIAVAISVDRDASHRAFVSLRSASSRGPPRG
jgi:hypothetical protein